MFSSGSPYSPFFTSGLMSVDSDSDDRRSSAFFFAVHAGRDLDEFRSFLSLDLAEARTLSTKSSQSSLRSIPPSKPAPSAVLPAVPQRRRPTITIAKPLRSSSVINIPLTAPADSRPFIQQPNNRRSWSTVSTRYRKTKRSDALARLEGRSDPAIRFHVPSSYKNIRNFMSMSDDEDMDGDNEYEDQSDDDSSFFCDDKLTLISAIEESENLVVPPDTPTLRSSPPVVLGSPLKSRKNRFPLKSFIDLRDREASPNEWGWRSFIHIAAVS